MEKNEQFNIYQMVTDRIIEQLKKGIIPWERPWFLNGDGAYSGQTKKNYSLLNQMLLNHTGAYLTINHIQKLGGKVKKGARCEYVVFWKFIDVKDDEAGEIKSIPLLRYFKVFHFSDIENIDFAKVERKKQKEDKKLKPTTEAERLIQAYLCKNDTLQLINYKERDRAYYLKNKDLITVPKLSQFENIEAYYSTLFHEIIHSTGHHSRLNRDLSGNFGTKSYSKEELIAEIGSAGIMKTLGIETKKTFEQSTAYIHS